MIFSVQVKFLSLLYTIKPVNFLMLMFCCGTKFLFIEDVAQKQNYMKDIIYLFLAMRTMASLLSPDMATTVKLNISNSDISNTIGMSK